MNDSGTLQAEKIVNHMLENDPFSIWLGIQVLVVKKGSCTIRCTIREEMHNGFGVTHGGVLFSIADSAVAFAAASHGRIALAIDHSISFIKKTESGDVITAQAETISMGYKTGFLNAKLTNQNQELIADIKGTVYRSSNEFKF